MKDRSDPKKRFQVGLRLRGATLSAVEGAAAKNGHSINSELVARIEQSLREDRVMAKLEAIEAAVNAAPEIIIGGSVQIEEPDRPLDVNTQPLPWWENKAAKQ